MLDFVTVRSYSQCMRHMVKHISMDMDSKTRVLVVQQAELLRLAPEGRNSTIPFQALCVPASEESRSIVVEESQVSDPAPVGTRKRFLQAFIIAPVASLMLVAVLYLVLSPQIPNQIAIHVGPDGVGYGSTAPIMLITWAVAAVVLAIGGSTAREFVKNKHWYQKEKVIAVSIVAVGYGVIGVALATMLSMVGVSPEDVSGDSVGAGLLGFLVFFIAAIWVYIVVLPRGKMESLG